MIKVEDHEGKQVYVINKKEYVELTWARDMQKAIEHVRELLTKFEQEPVGEMVNYHLVADRIRTALSGQ
jgi:hypothetical protein